MKFTWLSFSRGTSSMSRLPPLSCSLKHPYHSVLQLYSTVLALYWDASCNHCCSLQWPKNFAVVWNTHRSSMDCLSNNSNQHPWIAFAHVQLRLELQAVADSCNRSTASTNCAGGSASEVSTKEAFQATTWTRFPEPNFSSYRRSSS